MGVDRKDGSVFRPTGRPTKYTPAVVETITRALRQGNTRSASAAFAGIDYNGTWHRWFERKVAFREAVLKAEAECEVAMVARVKQAAQTDWKAAAWWLERRRYAEWRRIESLQVEGNPERPIQLDHKHEVTIGIGSSAERLAQLASTLDVMVRVGVLPAIGAGGEDAT